MKTTLQIDISYDQVLALALQLSKAEKVKLAKGLEEQEISTRLSSLLSAFKTDELDLNMVEEEVEIVRRYIYMTKRTCKCTLHPLFKSRLS